MTAGILTFAWLLWPLVTLAGGLGFAPLTALMALALAPLAITRLRPRWYMLALLVFLAWAGFTATWSPRQLPLIEFDFAAGDFAVRSEMLRVGLLAPAVAILITAVARLDERARERIIRISGWAMLAQLVIIVPLAVFEQQVLDFLTRWIPDQSEGVQNLSRNSLILSLSAVFLIMFLIEGRRPWIAVALAAGVIAVESAVLVGRGVQGGLLAIFAAALAIAVIAVWRTNGFRIIGVGLALLVWTAPMIFGLMSLRFDDPSLASTSSEWRLAIWNRVIEVTAERPIEGAGLGVLRTIDETIPDGPLAGQLLVPNHAHNMLLQLWAETGAIGAGLLAITLILGAWRLPPPERLGVAAPRLAGLAGGAAAIACVSFDLWNEWWWALVGLLGVLCAVAAPRPVLEPDTFPDEASDTLPEAEPGEAPQAPRARFPSLVPFGAPSAQKRAATDDGEGA